MVRLKFFAPALIVWIFFIVISSLLPADRDLLPLLLSLAFSLVILLVAQLAFPRVIFAAWFAFLIPEAYINFRGLHELFTPTGLRFIYKNFVYLEAFFREYILTPQFACVWAILFCLIFFVYRRTTSFRFSKKSAFLGLLVCLALQSYVFRHARESYLSPDVSLWVSFGKFVNQARKPEQSLYRAVREKPLLLEEGKEAKRVSENILLVINESWSAEEIAIRMPQLWSRLSDQTNPFFYFKNAYSNAGATDVSVPSLLTGVGPEESAARLHRVPLIFDYGVARGLVPFFLSSQSLQYSGLAQFIANVPYRKLVTAQDLGPFVNDLGVDDCLLIKAFQDALQSLKPSENFIMVVQTNALHDPFQAASSCVPASELARMPRRLDRAYKILDVVLDQVLGALKVAHRFDDTIVFMTGDHADTDRPSHLLPRVVNFHKEIVHVPMFAHLPGHFQNAFVKNREANVQNLDIVPTIARILEMRSHQSLKGSSLLSKISLDRMIITLNTNELRQWEPRGFSLMSGNDQLVFQSQNGFELNDQKISRSEIPKKFLEVIESEPLVKKSL